MEIGRRTLSGTGCSSVGGGLRLLIVGQLAAIEESSLNV